MRYEEVDEQKTSSLRELNVSASVLGLCSLCGQASRSGETISFKVPLNLFFSLSFTLTKF